MPAKEVLTFDVADYTDPPTAHRDFGTLFCCAFRDSLPPTSVCDSLENRLSLMPSQDIYVLLTMLDGHLRDIRSRGAEEWSARSRWEAFRRRIIGELATRRRRTRVRLKAEARKRIAHQLGVPIEAIMRAEAECDGLRYRMPMASGQADQEVYCLIIRRDRYTRDERVVPCSDFCKP